MSFLCGGGCVMEMVLHVTRICTL